MTDTITIGSLCDRMDADDNIWIVFAIGEDGASYVVLIDGVRRTPLAHGEPALLPINLQDAGHETLAHGVQWHDDTPVRDVAHVLKANPIVVVQYLHPETS